MENKRILNMKSLYAIIAVFFLGMIGTTFAYFGTNNTFTNEFNAGEYKIKTQEVFESPTDWKPGDQTPKVVNVKNEGTIGAAVKVCFEEKIEDKNGNNLSLFDSNGTSIANLGLQNQYFAFWKKDCNSNCYYYYKMLAPGETTENLLEKVTYSTDFIQPSTINCTEDSETHSKTCTSNITDYNGAKYTLDIKIETVQYQYYHDTWGNPQIFNDDGGTCRDLNIMRSIPNRTGIVAYKFRDSFLFRDNELANYDMSEATCSVVYINTVSEDNKYNKCYGVTYIDGTNHQSGEIINVKSIPVKALDLHFSIVSFLPDGSTLLNAEIKTGTLKVRYDKYVSILNYFPVYDDDVEVMNFDDEISSDYIWETYGLFEVPVNSSFIMPDHGVLFDAFYEPGPS